MRPLLGRSRSASGTVVLMALVTAPLTAQETPPEPNGAGLIDIEQSRLPVPDRIFDIDRAVQIGIRNNRTLQVSRLDLATAEKQVKEAYGGLVPEIDGSMG